MPATTPRTPFADTVRAAEACIVGLIGDRADIEPDLRLIEGSSDAVHVLSEMWHGTADPAVRWATIFLVSHLGRLESIPFLIEVTVRPQLGDDDPYSVSAARIAGATLVRLVELSQSRSGHGPEPSSGRWIQPSVDALDL